MNIRSIIVLLTAGFLIPSVSLAEEADSTYDFPYRLTLGISVYSTDLEVKDKNSNAKGTLSEEFGYSPFLALESPYRYFNEKTDFGWFMEYGLGTFKLDRQLVNGQLVDLGTSVRGYHATITPVLFYNFGDRLLNGHSFKLGVGTGLGYLHAKGDIILTESPVKERHDFKINDLGLAVYVLFDYRYKNLNIRVSGSGPTIDKGDHEYEILSFDMDIGYMISF